MTTRSAYPASRSTASAAPAPPTVLTVQHYRYHHHHHHHHYCNFIYYQLQQQQTWLSSFNTSSNWHFGRRDPSLNALCTPRVGLAWRTLFWGPLWRARHRQQQQKATFFWGVSIKIPFFRSLIGEWQCFKSDVSNRFLFNCWSMSSVYLNACFSGVCIHSKFKVMTKWGLLARQVSIKIEM